MAWFDRSRGRLRGRPAAASAAEEQHCKLELVRLPSGDADSYTTSEAAACRNVTPQVFARIGREDGDESAFKKVVKREPAKYVSTHPFRGVATLGSKQYGFVLDKQDAKSEDFDRLYFDLNGNGDLTDDKPIEKPAKKAHGKLSGWSWLFGPSEPYESRQFPARRSNDRRGWQEARLFVLL